MRPSAACADKPGATANAATAIVVCLIKFRRCNLLILVLEIKLFFANEIIIWPYYSRLL